jgi:putative nucleotidyltransferase with HDIG domain
MEPRAAAVAVARRLIEAGFRALLAGGCVRDRLLGREPSDYDVATAARPDQVAALFPRVVPLGERFGSVQVRPEPDASVEVTTFRTEAGYADGRRPDAVAFGASPEEDARRRDFTVNALFEEPETGEVLDFVGGRDDIGRRLIRAVGDPRARFAEDRLRLLRAVRFAARFGWNLEPGTLAAARDLAPTAVSVSAERTREELRRILVEGGAARGLDLLRETGLLPVVLPEVAACIGVAQPPDFHPEGDVFVHTRLVVGALGSLEERPSTALAFGALFHDVGKPPTFAVEDRIRFNGHDRVGAGMAAAACRRLRFSNADTDAVEALVARHMVWPNLPVMREAKLRRFLADPMFEEHAALHRLDCMGSHGDLSLLRFAVTARERFAAEAPRPPRVLTGDDLVALGLPPGPAFARILRFVEDAWLERRVASKEEALKLVRDRFLGAGAGPAEGPPEEGPEE